MQPRPFIPLADRQATFADFHQLALPGIHATHRLMAASVIWEGMNRDVLAWCQDCQRAKVTKQPAATIQPIPVPRQRSCMSTWTWSGPSPLHVMAAGYLFTMIDRTSCWIEAVPLKDMEAATCADAFIAM